MLRFLCAGFGLLLPLSLHAETAFPVDSTPADHASGDSAILAKVTPAIVSVFPARLLEAGEGEEDELMERFFNRGGDDEPEEDSDEPREDVQGVGSGVIVSADGLIITNSHVVHLRTGKLADAISVELSDRRRFPAKILGADPLTDLALLKVEARGLPVLPIADSNTVRVGDKVFAVGNPFKIGLTATKGMVSALNRSGLKLVGEGGYESFIQTDAPINPGNSGGALVDSLGRLVGINTAIYAGGGGGNVGIGFAVPSNLARHICTRLLDEGEVRRGFLGIKVKELTAEVAKDMKLEVISGVLVEELLEGGPADKAGIERGDLITTVSGKPVRDRAAFRLAISLPKPGESLTLAGLRSGEAFEDGTQPFGVTAVLSSSRDTGAEDATFELLSLPGVRFRAATTGGHEGLEITGINSGSPFTRKLEAGMLLIEANNKPVRNFADANIALRKGVNEFRVFHEGRIHTIALRLES